MSNTIDPSTGDIRFEHDYSPVEVLTIEIRRNPLANGITQADLIAVAKHGSHSTVCKADTLRELLEDLSSIAFPAKP